MKTTDEDLQEQFDQEKYPEDSVDAQAYQKVFEALGRQPEYTLPVYFADRLVNLIEAKEKTKEVSRDNLWLGLGLLAFGIALVVTFVLTEFKISFGAFQFIAGNAGFIAFGLAFILMLNWVDRKIIRKVEAF